MADGSTKVLAEDLVDLEVSRAAWNRAEPWLLLDTSPLQGRQFPQATLRDVDGRQRRLEWAAGTVTAVVMLHAYCTPCVTRVEQARKVVARDGLPAAVRMATVVIDPRKDVATRMAERLANPREARWSVGWLEEAPEWLESASRGGAISVFLVADSGCVAHSLLQLPLHDRDSDTFWPTLREAAERLKEGEVFDCQEDRS
jgi:hypothetical protein